MCKCFCLLVCVVLFVCILCVYGVVGVRENVCVVFCVHVAYVFVCVCV